MDKPLDKESMKWVQQGWGEIPKSSCLEWQQSGMGRQKCLCDRWCSHGFCRSPNPSASTYMAMTSPSGEFCVEEQKKGNL